MQDTLVLNAVDVLTRAGASRELYALRDDASDEELVAFLLHSVGGQAEPHPRLVRGCADVARLLRIMDGVCIGERSVRDLLAHLGGRGWELLARVAATPECERLAQVLVPVCSEFATAELIEPVAGDGSGGTLMALLERVADGSAALRGRWCEVVVGEAVPAVNVAPDAPALDPTFTVVGDVHAKQRFNDVAMDLISGPFDLQCNVVEERGWVGVPVQVGGPLWSDEDSGEYQPELHLVRALGACGFEECLLVDVDGSRVTWHGLRITIESVRGLLACYLFDSTEPALRAVERDFASSNVLLTSPAGEFAILLTVEGYCLVAGPRRFVESALGVDVATARSMFAEYARDSGSDWYLELAHKYEDDQTDY